MEQYLELLRSSLEQIGPWFVVPFLFLENIPFLGFIAPGVTIMVLSGYLYSSTVASTVLLFFIAWLTLITADTIWYSLGYLGQRNTRLLRKIAARSPNVDQILTQQSRYVLVCYQFIPYFRMFLPFALGLYRYSPTKWLVITFVGSFLFTFVFIGIGVLGRMLLGTVTALENLTNAVNTVLVIVAVLYLLVLLYKFYKIR